MAVVLRRQINVWLPLLATLLAVGCGAVLWLHAAPANREAVAVSDEFLLRLEQGRVEQAYALTLQAGSLLGADLAAFARISAGQRCGRGSWQAAGTHPPQSRGNRLRRWLAGREVEMPSVTVRYDGAPNPCPLSVELRRDVHGAWRIFNFQSTAG